MVRNKGVFIMASAGPTRTRREEFEFVSSSYPPGLQQAVQELGNRKIRREEGGKLYPSLVFPISTVLWAKKRVRELRLRRGSKGIKNFWLCIGAAWTKPGEERIFLA
eukprot:94930-Hanusia_phi.AAC.1